MNEKMRLAAMDALEEFQRAFEKMDQAFGEIAEHNDNGFSVLGNGDKSVENALSEIENQMEKLDVL